ncbi:MAG: endonuclease/exonuclease/phosphatase family protein [Polyangiaceae bacterium]
MKRWLLRLLAWSALAYPACLVLFTLALRCVGEDFWATSVALYLPRLPLAVPLLVLVPLLWRLRLRRLLWLQAFSAFMVLVPLMGWVPPRPHWGSSGKTIRVMSYNVNSCHAGVAAIVARIRQYNPDLMLVQELAAHGAELEAELKAIYPFVRVENQFLLASRFPVPTLDEPRDPVEIERRRHGRFAFHEVETPLGKLAVLSVHPLSPRSALRAVRGRGLPKEILSGRLLRGEADAVTERNSERREDALRTGCEMAANAKYPVIIAGDTNLPGLSPVLAELFGKYQDGFVAAGSGFGYSFPSRWPFMRIDRIFAGPELAFTHFETDCGDDSDHQCVVADIERREQ